MTVVLNREPISARTERIPTSGRVRGEGVVDVSQVAQAEAAANRISVHVCGRVRGDGDGSTS